MAMSQDERDTDPSAIARSIELLARDPALYGEVLAREAFDHFVSSRMEGTPSGEKRGSDEA